MSDKTKSFDIPIELVEQAYVLVKTNQGGAGIDQESLVMFDQNKEDNLYKIWNRLASGSYFPPPVKGVEIPKKQGGTRLLGVPTVSDRIAQMIIRLMFEPEVEPHFLDDSYGYRPNKSALDAIGVTRKRCWSYDYLLEFDIKGLFDNIDHELLMKAVKHHTQNKCIILYIERWINAPLQLADGTIQDRNTGTPQGGVISPLLSNLFLHYVFDVWMTMHHSNKPWCRYADDGIVHCKTEIEAQSLLIELKQRFLDCKLEIHPLKTKIVYCKDGKRNAKHQNTSFVFLGYEFRARSAINKKTQIVFTSFLPAICKKAKQGILSKIRELNVRNRSDLSIQQIAKWLNPMLRGWFNYYGKFTQSAINVVFQRINASLVRWSMRKFDKLRGKTIKAARIMEAFALKNKSLFVHWKIGITGAFI